MEYYKSNGYEVNIGTKAEIDAIDTSDFRDGIKAIAIDTGLHYIIRDGVFELDKSRYDATAINSSGEFVNTADILDSGVLLTEDLETKYFREGFVYCAGARWNDVPNGEERNIHLFTGSKPIYMEYYVNGVALTDYEVIVDPTINDNGTPLTIFNRNERKGNSSLTLAYENADIGTDGTTCVPRFLGSEGNAATRSGGLHSSQNAIFSENSHIIFRVTNSNTQTQERMGIVIDWFEFDSTM